ncbi:MAG: hypothetical protein JRF02_08055, partial [Deltaproteobacteria bacterium]|nr:hypothetical protein [Deltaproteobacteria bacterium]
MEIDIPLIKKIAKRGGVTTSHLPWRLLKSFENFAALDINSLFLDIGTGSDDDQNNIKRCLEISGNYFHVIEMEDELPIDKKNMPAIIYNETSQPDPNLTLLAAYNKIQAKAIQDIVPNISKRIEEAEPDSPLKKCSSVFDAVFHFKKMREKLKRPPLEINNARWLLVAEDEQVVKEDLPLTQEVLKRLLNEPQNVSQILASTYGDELLGFNAEEVGKWLKEVFDLLQVAKDEGGEDIVSAEIMFFLQKSFDHVADDVLGNLDFENNEIVCKTDEGEELRLQIPEGLETQLVYYKKRAQTRSKMQNLLDRKVKFTEDDFGIIAEDFAISIEDAKKLYTLLQSSFDQEGHFQRKVFEKNLKEFAKYERNIFQFLWHYLKLINNRNDRVSYLNSLQLLIAEMKDLKQALLVLLAD